MQAAQAKPSCASAFQCPAYFIKEVADGFGAQALEFTVQLLNPSAPLMGCDLGQAT